MRKTNPTIEYVMACRIDMNSNYVAALCMVHGCTEKQFAGVVCTLASHYNVPCYAFICEVHADWIGSGSASVFRFINIANRHSRFTQCFQHLDAKKIVDGDVVLFPLEEPRIET